ncbi:MAG: hypothetical protein F6K50_12745 [Moorea sp. SIO3I7]|uniref:hypothetical protein n=1 Tax=unclassified Moorena TaxID=2683338 RepID=UPI0013C26425|nr:MULTISPECIES: hypothetical protein [unclassified Moorena]NEN96370.1 hypothetical protein [Moorena sp. SIO3I7]NEO07502.1 hypothetical protein [Moorena sp. SIO3I8]NEP24287.1 hypothetical protein [Moorena sp. SIO3I6]
MSNKLRKKEADSCSSTRAFALCLKKDLDLAKEGKARALYKLPFPEIERLIRRRVYHYTLLPRSDH